MTPRSIVLLALKLAGVTGLGQKPRKDDLDDALLLMNMMMGQWAQKRWLVYHEVEVSLQANGSQSYSIGPGGDFDVVRPDRIQGAFVRMGASPATPADAFILDVSALDVGVLDGSLVATPARPGLRSVDYPLDVIEAREDWSRIGFKGMSGFPSSVFYDSNYPLGAIYVNPVPGPQYEIHLVLKQPLSQFASLDDDVALPAQYHEALLYNLAGRLAPLYGMAQRSDVVALAAASLNTVRNSNTQVGRLRMPAGLPGMGRGGWMGGYGGIAGTGIGSSALGSVAGYELPADYPASGDPTMPPGVGTGPAPGPTPASTPGTSSYAGAVLGQSILGQMILGAGAPPPAAASAQPAPAPSTSVLGQSILGQMVLGA